jgi:dipeptidyl aminopeptidase/acylaminoacyl peptidase
MRFTEEESKMKSDCVVWASAHTRAWAKAHATIIVLLSLVATDQAPSAEPDPRRPAAIEAEGVPPVPPELFDRLAQYEEVRSAAFQGWSPTGGGVLISTRFANSVQLHRVYHPGGRREQITFFPEPVSGRFVRAADDDAVLLSMSRGGDENFQVYLLDRQAYKTHLLTDGKSRNTLGPLTRDGSRAAIANNARNGRDTDLYVLDPREPGSLRMVMQTDGQFWQPADWSPDGKTLLVIRVVSINETYPALLDTETGKRTDLPLPKSASNEPVAIGDLAFSADGLSVLMSCDARGEFLELARLDLESLAYEWPGERFAHDVEAIEVDEGSDRAAFTVNEEGASRLYLLEGDATRALELPLGVISGLEFSPDGAALGFTLARPDAPADVYSVRLADGELTRWTYSEAGGLDPASFVTPSRIKFPSFDGRQIGAYVFKPRSASAEKKAPVIINIHGGPESQYRPLFSGSSQFFVNELGLAVIAPNVRGSSGHGKTFLKLDNADKREDSVRDIGALLDWIATQPDLDASRVAVAGGSYGGYMVLASLVHYGDRLKAGVDIVGIASFQTFLENTAPYRRDLRRVEYGDERDPKMQEVFLRIDPLHNAEKIVSALLVAHGKNDPRVPFSEAEQIAAKVRSQGRPVWTVYADNEGHGFGKKDNSDYVRAVQAMFLKEQLGL